MVTLKEGNRFFSPSVLLFLFFGVVGGMVFQTPTIAQELEAPHLAEITEINKTIQRKGARWVAGETSVSRLSAAKKTELLGLVKPTMMGEEEIVTSDQPQAALTPSLDWRNNGGNFVTPIRNQGGCGSCWAFAATAALESATLIYNNAPGVDLDLGEQILVSCSGAGSCGGGSPSSSAQYIQTAGLPLESCYPYTAANGNCANACSNWQASSYKISSWRWVTYSPATVDALKNAVAGGPIITTFAVYSDFFSYVSGVYSYTSGSLAGYHAVLLIGYDDPGQYFIAKNSWGAWWGESGYFRIAYSEVNGKSGFGEYSLAYGSAVPPSGETIASPTVPSGSGTGGIGTSYAYTIGGASSSQGDSVQYLFDWNDGTDSGWLPVGQTSASKSWSSSGTYYVKGRARCATHTSALSSWSSTLTVSISSTETVSAPTALSGVTSGTPGTSYTYSTGGSSSSLGHSIQYLFDWGDGTTSGWLAVGQSSAPKSWASSGTYSVKAQARCAIHTSTVSGWSSTLTVGVSVPETVSIPTVPSGPSSGILGTSYTYTTGGSSSSLGHSVQYYFDWGDSANSGWLAADTTSASKTWTSGGTIQVKTKARCAIHNSVVSSWSSSFAVTILCATPRTPLSPSPSSGATGVSISPTLSWAVSSNADSYDVYFGTSSNPPLAGNTTSTSYPRSGLSYSTTYYWKVVAKNICGNSMSGSVWSFTTLTHSTPHGPTVDFNGDGETDILWRHNSTGGVYVWYMNGMNLASGAWVMGGSDLNWEIVGTGDFNSDSKTDILWRDKTTGGIYVWYLDGVNLTSGAWVMGSSDLNWEIVGTGDFNSDSKTDILWRDKTTGGIYVWYMDGVNLTGGAWVLGSSDTNWEIVGTRDFNSDSKTDILWRDKTTGGIYVWYLDGVNLTSGAWVMGSSDLNWEIVGTGDFNSDSKTDILWRDKTTGGIYVWYMDGVNHTGGAWLLTSSDTHWEIVAP